MMRTVALAALAATAVQAETRSLTPLDAVRPVILESASGASREYVSLDRGQVARFGVCGAGELGVLTRALLDPGTTTARHDVIVAIDGVPQGEAFRFRSDVVASMSAPDGGIVGALRERHFSLDRGCHSIEVSVPRATTDRVAVRATWAARETTLRRWEPAADAGSKGRWIRANGRDSEYRPLDAGPLVVPVDGPAWVRLLVRSADVARGEPVTLAVRADGKPVHEWQLRFSPSSGARLDGRRDPGLSAPIEVTFPVFAAGTVLTVHGPGNHPLLVRPELAGDPGLEAPSTPAPWRLTAGLTSYYDSNILRYSDRFRRRFELGLEPARFRIRSLDDVILRADLALRRGFAGWRGRDGDLALALSHYAYQENPIKDRTRYRLTLGQDLGAGRRVELRGSWLLDYYVRHLRDRDIGRGDDAFQPFSFDRAEVAVRYRHELGARFDVGYELGRIDYDYSESFREFDSADWYGGLRLDQRVNRNLDLQYRLRYTDSSARGYDEPGETLPTSDDTDPSFRQLALGFGGRYEWPGNRHALRWQTRAARREYTTDKSPLVAPVHFGREDEFLELSASWDVTLSPRYRLSLYGRYRERWSEAPINIDIGDEKDYDQYEVGVRFSARFGR